MPGMKATKTQQAARAAKAERRARRSGKGAVGQGHVASQARRLGDPAARRADRSGDAATGDGCVRRLRPERAVAGGRAIDHAAPQARPTSVPRPGRADPPPRAAGRLDGVRHRRRADVGARVTRAPGPVGRRRRHAARDGAREPASASRGGPADRRGDDLARRRDHRRPGPGLGIGADPGPGSPRADTSATSRGRCSHRSGTRSSACPTRWTWSWSSRSGRCSPTARTTSSTSTRCAGPARRSSPTTRRSPRCSTDRGRHAAPGRGRAASGAT